MYTIRYFKDTESGGKNIEIKSFKDLYEFQTNSFGINGSTIQMITLSGRAMQVYKDSFTGMPMVNTPLDSVVLHGDLAKFVFANRESMYLAFKWRNNA